MTRQFDGLPPVFLTLLALWSLGLILARRCSRDRIACHLARLLGQSDNTVRPRLCAFCPEAAAKRGGKRRDFDVTGCFVPLLRWVLSFWSCPRLALVLDVTNMADRFPILRRRPSRPRDGTGWSCWAGRSAWPPA